jgi:hypothetical protein
MTHSNSSSSQNKKMMMNGQLISRNKLTKQRRSLQIRQIVVRRKSKWTQIGLSRVMGKTIPQRSSSSSREAANSRHDRASTGSNRVRIIPISCRSRHRTKTLALAREMCRNSSSQARLRKCSNSSRSASSSRRIRTKYTSRTCLSSCLPWVQTARKLQAKPQVWKLAWPIRTTRTHTR